MFVDRQRIDLLNRLIDARVDLAAYVQTSLLAVQNPTRTGDGVAC